MKGQGDYSRAATNASQNYNRAVDPSTAALPPPRVVTFPTITNNSDSDHIKIQELEKAMKDFRTEFQLKLDIVQEILTTRQEKFKVQKQLIDREETLYQKLLGNWTNVGPQAAVQIFPLHTDDDGEFNQPINEEIGMDSPTSPVASPRRSKRKRMKQRAQSNFRRTMESSSGQSHHDSLNVSYAEGVNEFEEPNTIGYNCGIVDPDDEEGDDDVEDLDFVPEGKDEDENNQTGKRSFYVFEKDKEFNSEEEAHSYVRAEHMWRFMQKREIADGTKRYYVCKYDRKCPARVNILHEHSTTGAILLYRTAAPHTHDFRIKHGLPNVIKQKIVALLDLNITTPRPILRKLREGGFPEPTMTQLRNFIGYERRRRLGIKYVPGSGNSSAGGQQGGRLKRGRPRLNLKPRNSTKTTQKAADVSESSTTGLITISSDENTVSVEMQPPPVGFQAIKIDPTQSYDNYVVE